ncbi:MAG: hypothetical protein C5B50_18740 [Verrucomicrobia bacterium]|nr:MAG: hypothetical protein C5B50_18740 [Verrucomicrobiota bacterium]
MQSKSADQSRVRSVLFGLAYFVVGAVSSALPGATAWSDQSGRIWRLAAWAISGLVFATHIGCEHFRGHNSPRSIALHVALAVAIGAFGLAVSATAHSLVTSHYRPAYLVALVAWPAIIAVPAFLIALGLSAILARLLRR